MTKTSMIRLQAPRSRWEDDNSYATGYLPQGAVAIGGQMMFSVSLAYDGWHEYVTFDPNKCSLDEFGDPTRCTRLPTVEYTLSIISHQEGPSPDGFTHHLYELAGPDYPGPRVFLMQTGPDPNAGYSYRGALLFADADGRLTTVLPMHRWSPPDGPQRAARSPRRAECDCDPDPPR